MLSYQWQGIEVATQRISALADLRGLDSELEGAGDDIAKVARVYPPERPNQRYIRTFTLQRGWRRSPARRTGGAVEVDVSNPTEYAPDVMGENQKPYFVGRWKRLRQIGEDQRGALRARAQAWALRTWRGQ